MSNPYKFSVYSNAAQTPTSNAWSLVNLDTELYDTGSNFSTSTHKFTAPVAGFYQFNASVGINSNADGQLIAIGLNHNTFSSAPTHQGTTLAMGAAQLAALTMARSLQLAANDTVSLYIYCNSSLNVGTTPYYTMLDGFLISES